LRAVRCCLLVGALAASSSRAWAEPTRIALSTTLPSDALDALRIQLGGIGAVEPATSAEAAGAALSRGVSVAVIVEGGDREATVTVLARGGGRASTHRIVVPDAATGPDFDRIVALKAAELVERVLAAEGPEPRPPPLAPSPRAYTPERGGVTAVEVGLEGVAQSALRARASIVQPHGATLLSASMGLRIGSDGDALVADRSVLVGAGAALPLGPVTVGAHLDAGLRQLRASAQAGDRMGTATAYAPLVVPAVEARVRAGPNVEVGFSLGALITLHRPMFSVDGTTVADVGLVRPVAAMSLAFRLR